MPTVGGRSRASEYMDWSLTVYWCSCRPVAADPARRAASVGWVVGPDACMWPYNDAHVCYTDS